MSIIKQLTSNKLIDCPKWLPSSICYEVIMGSTAYGLSIPSSDLDIYGFCMPPIGCIFPHLNGEIFGFSTPIERFDSYQLHHIPYNNTTVDVSIKSITNYFRLALDNNPNIIDSLFVPDHCILSTNEIGKLIRANRRKFLHTKAWPKFKGYAYSVISKLGGTAKATGKRAGSIDKYGFDVKSAYHAIRLLNEIEQILVEQNLDLQRNKEILQSIRDGQWTRQQIVDYCTKKELELNDLYAVTKLPAKPPEKEISQLLLNCIEIHYGKVTNMI